MSLENLNKTITKAHNYLYANEGLSNSESLEELLKLMYSKIEMERTNVNNFDNISDSELLLLTQKTFKDLMDKYPDIFVSTFSISEETIIFIMKLFWDINFANLKSDKKGHILQKVMDRSYRERNGQFFTPNAVVDFIVKMIEPKSYEKGGDLACGTGGFLFSALDYIFQHEQINALDNLYFFEISEQISKLIKMRSLFEFDNPNPNLKVCDTLSSKTDSDFDYILSNPPFGSSGKISNKNLLQQYELSINPRNNRTFANQVPDILFVEKIVNSLKYKGRAAIVLPDGNLENPSTLYLREYLLNKTKVDAIVALPDGTFIPYGTGVKASIVFFTKLEEKELQIIKNNNYNIFFAQINKLGYTFSKHSKEDLRSDGTLNQDYDDIVSAFKNEVYDDYSFTVSFNEVVDSKTFSYSYHSPVFNKIITNIKQQKYALLGDLVVLNNKKVKFDPEGTYKYVEIADINSSGSEIINFEPILGSDLPSRASYKIKENDVLVAIAGNAIGTSKHSKAIVTHDYNNCICTNGLAVIKAKSISPYFLIHFFNTDDFLDQIKKYKYGSAIPTISKEDLLNIVIPIYDTKTMEEIDKNIRKAYEYRELAQKMMSFDYANSLYIEDYSL